MYDSSAPATDFMNVQSASMSLHTQTIFDDLERAADESRMEYNTVRQTTVVEHLGDRTVTTPQSGGQVVKHVDADGNTTRVAEYFNGTTEGSSSPVHRDSVMTYNTSGFMLTATDPLGKTANFTYDLLGQQLSIADPDAGTSTYTYDGVGNRITSVINGTTLNYNHDELDRVWRITSGTTTQTTRATFAYDTLRKGQRDSATRVIDPSNSIVTAVTGYDARNRPTGGRTTINGPLYANLGGPYTYGYTYDSADRTKTVSYPSVSGSGLTSAVPAETATQNYSDAFLGSYSVSGGSPVQAGAPGYFDDGRTSSRSIGGAGSPLMSRSFQYQYWSGRVARVTTSVNGLQVQDDSIDYDPVGNVEQIGDQLVDQWQCFEYDEQHRMTKAFTAPIPSNGAGCSNVTAADGGPSPYDLSYTFDHAGGVKQIVDRDPATGVATTYDTTFGSGPGSAHPAHGPGTTTATVGSTNSPYASNTYMPDGKVDLHTVGADVVNFDWDAERAMSSATATAGSKAGQWSAFVYDADGNRIIERDHPASGADRLTLFLPDQEVRAPVDTSGTSTVDSVSRYYRAGGELLATRNFGSGGGTAAGTNWTMSNGQGTVELVTDTVNGTTSRTRYRPYGSIRGTSTLPTSRGFLGKTLDPVSGTNHLEAREYDAGLGFFLAPDPIADFAKPSALNPFGYGNANPLTMSDPSGLFSTGCDCDARSHPDVDPSTGVVDPVRRDSSGTGSMHGAGMPPPVEKPIDYDLVGPAVSGKVDTTWHWHQVAGHRSPPEDEPMTTAEILVLGGVIVVATGGAAFVVLGPASAGAVATAGGVATARFASRSLGGKAALKPTPVVGNAAGSRAGASLTRDQLNPLQSANFGRYLRKLPNAAGDSAISQAADGAVSFRTIVPGRVPGSYAEYAKTVNRAGETTAYLKTTYAPNGSIVHVKDKMLR